MSEGNPETAQRCRRCGCTEERACVTPQGPCYWVLPDLCSGCCQEPGDFTPETRQALDQPVGVKLRVVEAMMLIEAIQVACAHPEWAGSASREFTELWARELQRHISLTGQIRFFLDQGWEPRSVIQTPNAGGLILPPGFQR